MSAKAYTVTLNIPAGAVQPINSGGTNFHVVFSPVDILIKWPGAEFISYQQGSGVDNLPGNEEFNRLEVRNPTLGAITVVIYIGGPLYRDSRTNVIEPRTELDGWATGVIANGAGHTFDGIPSGLRIRRKSINVTNLDAASNLQIRDSATHVALTVFPQTSITLAVSESVEVYNASAAPVACNVSELWWTL